MKTQTTRERSRKFGPVYSKKLKQALMREAERRDERVSRASTDKVQPTVYGGRA